MEDILKNREWKEFKLNSILEIENCKCSNVSLLACGKVPYVGATNRNNGVIKFVEYNEKLITKGKCIAFICNGEGSVGYSIYKKEDFIGSTSIKVGRNKNLNKYVGYFITTVADRVRSKYNFGYARTDERLKKEVLSFPVNSAGQPDYAFMESYMRELEKKKLAEYKAFIDSKCKKMLMCVGGVIY